MRITRKERVAWVEGTVDVRADHISIRYGEGRKPVALLGRDGRKGFKVEFLLKARRQDHPASRILDNVRQELTFYLLDAIGPDSWSFAQYHCNTPANTRSPVHWSWHPARPQA